MLRPTQLAELDLTMCELDLTMCELDDLLPRAVITVSAWSEQNFLSRVPRGGIEPHKLVERGSTPRPATTAGRCSHCPQP